MREDRWYRWALALTMPRRSGFATANCRMTNPAGGRSAEFSAPRRFTEPGLGGARFRNIRISLDGQVESGILRFGPAVKTIARGMPGVSGVTVVTNARAFYTPRAAAGASDARHSLRPLSEGGKLIEDLGRIAPRDREIVAARRCCLKFEGDVCAKRSLSRRCNTHSSRPDFLEEDGLPRQAQQ